jgi:predicted metal-dependent hydrolase
VIALPEDLNAGHALRLPPALERFVALFNQGAFWESHEVLEGPWRATGSPFYQGLILLASAFVHAGRGNAHGVRAQLAKAERRLRPYAPAYLGVDVADLLVTADQARGAVARAERPVPPLLTLSPDRLRGDEPELAVALGA